MIGNALLDLIDKLAGSFVMRNDAGVVPFQGARVYNNAAISVNNGAATALGLNTERYDTIDCHSLTVNTSRITIPVAGYYHVGATARFAANVTGRRSLAVLLNGATNIVRINVAAPNASTGAMNVAADYLFAAGDYIEMVVFQDSGAALNIESASAESPEFWIHRIG